jgi:hypothetical protein
MLKDMKSTRQSNAYEEQAYCLIFGALGRLTATFCEAEQPYQAEFPLLRRKPC